MCTVLGHLVTRGTEEPQVPADHLPAPHACRLPARRTARHRRTSNFNRRFLRPIYREAKWRDSSGADTWTWTCLLHVFCITALFAWKLDPTDVSLMAGHANYRITLDMSSAPAPASSTAPA